MDKELIMYAPLLIFPAIGLIFLIMFKWDIFFLGLKLYKPLHKLTGRNYIMFGFGGKAAIARVKKDYDGVVYADYYDYTYYLNKDGTMRETGGDFPFFMPSLLFSSPSEDRLREYTPLTWKLEERPKQESNVVQLNN